MGRSKDTSGLGLEELSDLVGLVYDSAFEEVQWRSLTVRVCEICPGHAAAVNIFEDDRWIFGEVAIGPTGEVHTRVEAQRQLANAGDLPDADDLTVEMGRRGLNGLGQVVCTRDVFGDAQFRAFQTYKQRMAPIGAGHVTSVTYSIAGNRRAAFMVSENENLPFRKDTEQVKRVLSFIAPHFVRAARMARALTRAREAAAISSGLADAIALPLITTDAAGLVQMTNTYGKRLLEDGRLVRLDAQGALRLCDDHATRHLTRLLSDVIRDGAPHGLSLDLEDTTMSICISPFRPAMTMRAEAERRFYEGQQFFGIFIGAQNAAPINRDLLRAAFGLTTREAEVCSALADNLRPAQIAAATGRAEKTVRNQVQAVRQKIGVASAAELGAALSVFRTVGAMFDPGDPRIPAQSADRAG